MKRPSKDELILERDSLRDIGGTISNLLFNWAQDKRFTEHERASMNKWRMKWDAIKRAEIADAAAVLSSRGRNKEKS